MLGLLVIYNYKGIQWHNDNNASDVAYARAIGNTIAMNKRTVMAPIYLCVSLVTSKRETLIPSIDGKQVIVMSQVTLWKLQGKL